MTLFHGDSGVSSFNQLIHELSIDSDTSSVDYSSAEEDSDDGYFSSESPGSHLSSESPTSCLLSETAKSRSSQVSWGSTVTEHGKHWAIIGYMISRLLFPLKILLGLPPWLYHPLHSRGDGSPPDDHTPRLHTPRRLQSLKDHFIHRTTDRRRGVIEVFSFPILISLVKLVLGKYLNENAL